MRRPRESPDRKRAKQGGSVTTIIVRDIMMRAQRSGARSGESGVQPARVRRPRRAGRALARRGGRFRGHKTAHLEAWRDPPAHAARCAARHGPQDGPFRLKAFPFACRTVRETPHGSQAAVFPTAMTEAAPLSSLSPTAAENLPGEDGGRAAQNLFRDAPAERIAREYRLVDLRRVKAFPASLPGRDDVPGAEHAACA